MLDAIIVGAGISGLSAAYYLKQAGKDIAVLEASTRVGGLIETEHVSGYTVEFGPNSLRGDSLELQEIIEGVGLRSRIRTPALKRTRNYIATGGRLVAVPRSPIDLLRTRLLSGAAKRYLLTEPFHKPSGTLDDESVASFFRRRAGNEAVENLIKPLMSGIYAGDAEKLSIRSAFPKFFAYEQEYGSLLRGMLKAKKREKPDLPRMFSFDEGLSALPKALQAFLEPVLQLNTPVDRVERTAGGWRVITRSGAALEAKSLVLTTPLEVSKAILAPTIAFDVADVYCPPIGIVYLGFKKGDIRSPLDGFGFLVAPSENADILGCIYTSALFPDRAPQGEVLLTVLMGGATNPQITTLPKDEMERRGLQTLSKYVGIGAAPAFVHSHTWLHSIPQYNLGHYRTIEKIEAAERSNPGLHFGGNYRGGISIGSCMTTAKMIADRILGQ